MRAWQFHEFGDISNLVLEEVEQPKPGPGEVLLRMQCAALNPADRYMVQGQYPRPAPRPFSVGRDGCGVVEAVGPDETGREATGRLNVGDAVIVLRSDLGVSRTGTLAEYVVAPEDCLAPLPAGWSPEEGAAGPLVYLTAWRALIVEGGLEAGQTVLVTGASGGVGTAAVQLAKAMGATVIALSRSDEKAAVLRAMGADYVFDSNADDLEKQIKETLGGGRVDLVVEMLGGPFLNKAAKIVGFGGRILVVGLLAGLKSEVLVGLLIHKCLRIQGLSVSAYTEAESQEAWRDLVGVLDRTGARPAVDRKFEFGEVQEAFAHLAHGPLGKVVIQFP